MFPNFQFNETEILVFALILLRIASFLVAWPVFSIHTVPAHLKILLAVLIASLMLPVVDRQHVTARLLSDELIWLVIKEVFVGLCLGFITRFFFFAFSAGGNLIATSVGLASAQVFNPSMSTQSTTLEQFYSSIATLLFLAMSGHHVFLSGLAKSFELVPLSAQGISFAFMGESGRFVHEVFVMAIQISAPILVTIFLMNIAMGILGRAVPQINVLITSLPVNILIGLGVMILMLPVLTNEISGFLTTMSNELFHVMKEM